MTAEPLTPDEDGETPTCHELDHLQISVLEQRLDAARKASPPLDVERLATAIEKAFYDGDGKMLTVSRDNATAIAREYAALDPTP